MTKKVACVKYWQDRYAGKGNSGCGSRGVLAEFKAGVIDAFVTDAEVRSVLELGCGDGSQFVKYKTLGVTTSYLGLDVSPVAVTACKAQLLRAPRPRVVFAEYDGRSPVPSTAEMAMSMEVIFHLTDDPVYDAYMTNLFNAATRFVVIYSSAMENPDIGAAWVRHRDFRAHPATKGWDLFEVVPNIRPYPQFKDGSFSQFYFYRKSI